MNSFSHYMIGRFLLRYIKKEYGIRPGAARFLYWNVMTDFRKPYRSLSHMTDGWDSHVRSFAEELVCSAQAESFSGDDTSMRLGVLCHFYADFFCRAHTEAWEGTYRQHIGYELRLHSFMRKSFKVLCEREYRSDTGVCHGADDTNGHYETLRKAYLEEVPSFDSDVIYTLRACLGAVATLMRTTPERTTPERTTPEQLSATLTPLASGIKTGR
jgi:hypothetical protein